MGSTIRIKFSIFIFDFSFPAIQRAGINRTRFFMVDKQSHCIILSTTLLFLICKSKKISNSVSFIFTAHKVFILRYNYTTGTNFTRQIKTIFAISPIWPQHQRPISSLSEKAL